MAHANSTLSRSNSVEPRFAQRMRSFGPSPILQLLAKTDQMRKSGLDVISLGAGEAALDTPASIVKKAKRAIDAGQARYTPAAGTPELRSAIVEKFRKENDILCHVEDVVVTSGAKQAIFSAMMATVESGDDVIIPVPAWGSYKAIANLFGGRAILLRTTAENNYKVTPEQLARSVTPASRWLVLASPGNPTGAVYSREELLAIFEVIRAHPRLWIMLDSIYEHLVYDPQEVADIPYAAAGIRPRTLIVNGVSKAYRMTGWRIGYALGPRELIAKMINIQSQSTTCPCAIGQYAALEALLGPQDSLLEMRALFRDRRDLAMTLLSQIQGLTPFRPSGAMYVFCDCSSLLNSLRTHDDREMSDLALADYLLTQHHVAVVPGTAFSAPKHIRVSFATSDEILREGCRRLAEGVAAFR